MSNMKPKKAGAEKLIGLVHLPNSARGPHRSSGLAACSGVAAVR
jgi:hypothetical protein